MHAQWSFLLLVRSNTEIVWKKSKWLDIPWTCILMSLCAVMSSILHSFISYVCQVRWLYDQIEMEYQRTKKVAFSKRCRTWEISSIEFTNIFCYSSMLVQLWNCDLSHEGGIDYLLHAPVFQVLVSWNWTRASIATSVKPQFSKFSPHGVALKVEPLDYSSKLGIHITLSRLTTPVSSVFI
jgi:hypothetical protein